MKAQGLTACPRCGGDLDPARKVEQRVGVQRRTPCRSAASPLPSRRFDSTRYPRGGIASQRHVGRHRGASRSTNWRSQRTSWYFAQVAILDEVRAALNSRQYRISGHAVDEMLADALGERDILSAMLAGEVIEDYPKSFPFPACLVLGRTPDGIAVHAVWAFDRTSWYAVLVTVYRPDPARWTADFRTRVKR